MVKIGVSLLKLYSKNKSGVLSAFLENSVVLCAGTFPVKSLQVTDNVI